MLEYPAILTCKDRSIWIMNNVTVLYRTHALDMLRLLHRIEVNIATRYHYVILVCSINRKSNHQKYILSLYSFL